MSAVSPNTVKFLDDIGNRIYYPCLTSNIYTLLSEDDIVQTLLSTKAFGSHKKNRFKENLKIYTLYYDYIIFKVRLSIYLSLNRVIV